MTLLKELLFEQPQQNVIEIWFSPTLVKSGWANAVLQGPYGARGEQVVWERDGKYYAEANWWRGQVLPYLEKIWGPKGAQYGVDYGDSTNQR
jgi:hypothetical protein